MIEHHSGCWKLHSPSGRGRCNCGAEPDLDDYGCPACGAVAGCCKQYPNCPGNPEWKASKNDDSSTG